MKLQASDADQIIQHLKNGNPPPIRLMPHLHVGRERWLDGMGWYLDKAADSQLSAVRIVAGDYGDGKTHFLRMTSYLALQRNFVACEVTLTSDVRLDHFETVWEQIMGQLQTSEGGSEGIEGILNRWCKRTKDPAESLEALDGLVNLDPDFRQAMRGYMRAFFEGAGERDSYLQWLKGDYARPAGVKARIDRGSARSMLRSMCVFLKHIGYSGLVLYLDELELLFDQPRKQSRDMAYDTLRQLVEGTDGTPSFVLMGSATRLMLSHDKKGFPSFPPLAQRLGLPWLAAADDEFPDYRSTVIDLGSKSARLTEKELLMLVKRVRTAHGLALKWDADKHVPDAFLSDLAQTVDQQRGEFPAPRLLVEVVVSVLERKEQNIQMQLEQALPALLKQAKERIRDMEAKRHRPWSAEGSA